VSIVFHEASDAPLPLGVCIRFDAAPLPDSQLGRPRNAAFNADPVNTATGNYVSDHTDLTVPGRGTGLVFARFYNSLSAAPGPMGLGWTHSYQVGLTVSGADQSAAVRWDDGRVDSYAWSGSKYAPLDAGVYNTLTREGDGTFTVRQKSQTRWRFTAAGRLESITDRNGNAVSLSYDGDGRLTAVQEPGGRALSLTYDGAGHIVAVTDSFPRTVTYGYDAAGRLTSVTDPDGGVEAYTYSADDQLLTATDPRGAVYLTNTYDTDRRVVTWQADAKGNRYEFAYDTATGQTTITDPLGQTSVDAHDVRLFLIRQTDRLGNATSYTYNDRGDRTGVTDKNGHTTTYTFDARGNVTDKADPLGHSTAITYDASDNPLTRTDESGGVTRFTYDERGNLLTATDPAGAVTSYTYDAFGQVLTVTDANGGVTTNTYDPAGNLVSVTYPLGAVTQSTYDAIGRRLTATDPRGFVTAFTYDGAGRVLSTTDPIAHVVAHEYDGNGNRTRTTDARGGVTTLAYDANNLLTTVTDALGGVTRHTYDALDRRLTTTDPRGQVTAFEYDAEGRLTKTTDPSGAVTRMTYDGVGNRTGVTDANGHTTAFAYDALNRLVTTTDPLGQVTRHVYDALGHVTRTTDAAGRETSFAYDAVGRLTQVTDPSGGTARYTYDAVGNRLTVTDPNNKTTTLTYDLANRLLTSTDALGRVSQFTYDASGNRTTATDATGVTLTYAYDALNRVTSIQPSAGPAVTFTYDAAGNRTGMADGAGATAYTYDLLSRLIGYTDAYGQAIGYEYDAVGNRTALVYPDGKRVTYGFDGANRLVTVTDWGARVTRYTYDAAGQMTGTTNANGITAAYVYDDAGRLTRLANQRADAGVIASYDYTLDAVGNRTAVAETAPLQASPAPTAVSYAYNAANEIVAAGPAAFTSDASGRLTSRTDAGMTTTFVWDAFDQLTQASGGATTVQYLYNGVGTRLARTVNGATTRFVVDPQPTLSQLLVETDGAGTPLARYVYGTGLIARVDTAGQALTYHFDPRGSTVAMTDATGTVVNRYAYDEFGAVRDKQETAPQPFHYVGQYGVMQEPNGLLFMRARYYLPAEGRFINVDPSPIFNNPQDLNLFVYANGNPITGIDPSGLAWWNSDTVVEEVKATRRKLFEYATQSWLESLVNRNGFAAISDWAVGGWKVVHAAPLISVAEIFGKTLGGHWDDAEMHWTENWARAFLAAGETALLGAGGGIVGGVLGFGSTEAGKFGIEASLDWQMRMLQKWIADPLGGRLYDLLPGLFTGQQSVITLEQREVQRPVPSTNKKAKRDTRR